MLKKLIIALSIITLIDGCIPIATTLINNDLESKAKQNASSKYHEFVASLRTSCNQDVKDYTVYGVTYSDSRLEQVIIMCYFQMEILLIVIRMYQKIGVLDNVGLFITIGEGIKDKDGNNLKEKRVCKLPNVTNGE